MKPHLATLFIALAAGFIGGRSSEFLFSRSTPATPTRTAPETDTPNPFRAQPDSDKLATQVEELQNKIKSLEIQLAGLEQQPEAIPVESDSTQEAPAAAGADPSPGLSDRESLVAVGVSPDLADDILRRVGQQQYRRMELQNLMRHNRSGDTQQYRNELKELGEQRISLRSELGDETYDQYLFASGKNNRIKVASVMAGSPAESNGFEQDDVILYYGEQRILDGEDIRAAAWGSNVNSFVDVEILRGGNRMTLTMPGGTLGIRLQPLQNDPAQQ